METGLLDPAMLSQHHDLTPSETARLQRAQVLVGWGGELDAPAVQAFEQHNNGGTIVLASPAVNDDRFEWLDPEKALEAIKSLSESLQEIYPEQANSIARQESVLTSQINQTARKNSEVMSLVSNRGVFLDTDRLLPFAERQGLEVLGVLTYQAQLEVTEEQLESFQAKVRQYDQAVMLISSQVFTEALGEDESKPTLSTIYIDPIIVGYVGTGHYQQQLSRNVMMLTAGLTTTPTVENFKEFGSEEETASGSNGE